MQPWQTIDRASAPDGTELVLTRRGEGRGEEWVVRAAGQVLMSSRLHGSEETLVKYALERVKRPTRVVVGGLGLGFTLRAALDQLPKEVVVRVVELVPELVRWGRTHVAHLARDPLADPRTKVEERDVYDVITESRDAIDLLILDIDNGPTALTQKGNGRLYSEAGAKKCSWALAKGGVLAVWSAGDDARYRRNLEGAGLTVETKSVPAREGSGSRDVLFLAKK